MSLAVDHNLALKVLKKAWNEIDTCGDAPALMRQPIEKVISASDVTFKYILVTGFLAKCINPDIHSRALQVGSTLNGAYDARSLCHKVVVGFEKEKGNLFGLSNEPFVNKPARHQEHDGKNTQLRNKTGAQYLHLALEQAQTATAMDVYKGLVHILRLGRKNAENQKTATVSADTNLEIISDFITQFLIETDGGCRLVGVWGAFQQLLTENGHIKVYSPNASDRFAGTTGDVEVYFNKELVSASECKQRPLNLDDVKHGIKKAQDSGVPEYFFVISAGIMNSCAVEVMKTIDDYANKLDLTLVNIWEEHRLLAAMLNPIRRAEFGCRVVTLLKEMRKFESANVAANLWNQLIG